MRQGNSSCSTCFTTEVFLVGSGVDLEDVADAEFDAQALCFDGFEPVATVSAATTTDTAAAMAAAALSS
jgi:hypothetical protein